MTEIVLGPPGTGKTTTLLNIVESELARGVPPDRIGYVTFTRRGADEAIGRAAHKFNMGRGQFPYFRTLHSLCFRALGLKSGDVMEREKLMEFADYAGVRITGRWSEDGSFNGYETGDRCLFMENLARMRGIPLRVQYDLDDDRLSWATVSHVATCLKAFKEAHGLMDYTDMLLRFVQDNAAPMLETLLVDEAQDLSNLQWKVVDVLRTHAKRVVVAGDDDQAIYRWAGADVDTLIHLPGSVTVLGQSWRVPKKIQTLAGEIIGHVKHRREKAWSPRPSDGTIDRVADFLDADLREMHEPVVLENQNIMPVLILARNQYVLKEQVEPELRRRGIVYEMNGHSSVRPAVLQAVADWEALRAGKTLNASSVSGVYKYLTVGVGVKRGLKTVVDQLDPETPMTIGALTAGYGLLTQEVWHEALDRIPRDEMSYMLAARRSGEKLLSRPHVQLSTIHGAKGGQARHVVLFNEMARRTFVEMRDAQDDEARVFYVGVTRARERLTIVSGRTMQFFPHL